MLAAACLLAAGTAAGADGIPGAWHVDPAPEVRAMCHVGDALWVGTAAGLFIVDIRDGSLIERVGAGPRLPSASVRAIVSTGDSVFVATDDGLALFLDREVRVFTPRAPGPLAAVPLARTHSLSIGRSRDVLVASLGHGAGVIARGGGYAITRRDSLIDDIVFDVRDARDGRRYFATNAGLCAQIGDTTFAWYQAGAGLPRGEVRQLSPGEGAAMYVLVARHGVYRFEGGRATRVVSPPDVPLGDAHAISVGVDGTLWAAGNGWIVRRRANRWAHATFEPGAGLAGNWDVVVADGAGAFAGSRDGVVLALERGAAMHVDLGGGLPAPRAEAIAPDGRGSAWFVSGGRLVLADEQARRVVVENAPADARVVAISPSGAVIAAGRWTVRERDAAGWTDMRPDVIENDPSFSAARFDADGALWVGMRSGAIYRYDGDIWLRMARGSETMDGRGILDVRSAPGGTWAIGAGIPVRCADGGIERFAGIDSSDTVVDLERSPAGEWVAVTGTSLFVFDNAADVWRRQGLAYLVPGAQNSLEGRLTAIAFDGAGTAYLGSTEGIGVASARGTTWLRARDGIGGGEITDLVVDGERLWVGFAKDGLSTLPVGRLR